MKYLDYIGLVKMWKEMSPHVIFYGTCNTLSNVQEKYVRVNGLVDIVEGTRLIVKFANKNTHETPTLQIDSANLAPFAACPIIDENGNTITAAGAGRINNYCEFVYNGNGYWVLISSQIDNQIIYTESASEPAGEEGMIWFKKKT